MVLGNINICICYVITIVTVVITGVDSVDFVLCYTIIISNGICYLFRI